jgi:tetratricopeptide (TPR) repeat protein
MRRDSATADDEGSDDLDRAKKNLHRALAIDDANMPAMNQLALLHLERARKVAGPKNSGKKAGTQALEMAALVTAQAIKKNPRWAPIHNTAGLIEVEMGNMSRAAAAFDEARRLDPGLVEAQMNLASLNLHVRGYARAEEAYRAVLARHPDDYDARVGLSLAIRGQIDEASADARVAAAEKELVEAKRIAPNRPEAYFNEGILVLEYGGRGRQPAEAIDNLRRAKGLFEEFLVKSEGAPALAEMRLRAKGRLLDIDRMAEVLRGMP